MLQWSIRVEVEDLVRYLFSVARKVSTRCAESVRFNSNPEINLPHHASHSILLELFEFLFMIPSCEMLFHHLW